MAAEKQEHDQLHDEVASVLDERTLPGVRNNRQTVIAAANMLHYVGGYDDLARSLRTSAEERFGDQDETEGILTSDEVASKVVEAVREYGPLGRLARWLRAHPREFLVVSFRESRGDEDDGMFLAASQFGEEAPTETFEARAAAVREWLTAAFSTADRPTVPLIDDSDVRDLLDRLEDVNVNVMAGGAIYGSEPTLDEAVGAALAGAGA